MKAPLLQTIDFETYYDKEYSLSKMLMEDYITDPRFEVILVSVKADDQPVQWFTGTMKQTGEWLRSLDLHKSAVVAHNAMFDLLILKERFGISVGVACDTMAMAQAHLRPFTYGVSLAKCLEYTECPIQKGDTVHNMIGRSRASLSRDELEEYAGYCCNDTDSTHWLFNRLRPLFPKEEFIIMDQTLRMYLNPKFELDAHLLAEVLQEEQAKKAQLLASVQSIADKTKLMSNDKFADVLLALGVEPPRKLSPATGKLTWAFAKGDTGFKQMQEDFEDDPTVSTLLDARLGVKSTIAESRTARLLKIAQRRKLLRVPLGYYRAHTGRYGGMEKINLQNPPRVDKSRLRYALRAPPGHLVLAADLSQIEARIVAWLAGCQLLLNGFRNGEDVYSSFATNAYGVETVKGRSALDNSRRFVGKTCILGLGFGMGSEKLQGTLRKDDVKISAAEAGTLVGTYRNLYAEIPKLWTFLTHAGLSAIASGDKRSIGPCLTGKHMVLLPNGMPIYYHDLRKEPLTNEWVYTYGRETRQIWGGKLTENIVQALARILVMQNMITIREELGLEMALQVHDELDYIVPERDAQHLGRQIEKIMSTPPAWALDLPVAVEVKFGHTFGDCK